MLENFLQITPWNFFLLVENVTLKKVVGQDNIFGLNVPRNTRH